MTRPVHDTRTVGSADTDDADPSPLPDRNAVLLVGRVSGAPERRSLPSGDELVGFRLVVRRAADGDEGVDTLDVAVGPAPAPGRRPSAGQVGRRLLADAERLEDGARVEVLGELRRRWWGSGRVRQSRVEVRAHAIDRLGVRAGTRPARSGSVARA
jgi:single-strand DNA-binding protein